MGYSRGLCFRALLVPLMFYLLTYAEGRRHEFDPVYLSESNYQSQGTPKYDRIDEVKEACKDIIDSASELTSNDNRRYSIRHGLSFSGGDWDQKPGSGTPRPLMPFTDYNFSGEAITQSPIKASWFRITDVNNSQRSKKTIGVNGMLDMAITAIGLVSEVEGVEPRFQMWTGHTDVSIFFQGVYMESEKKGGERVMCLLGSAMLPVDKSVSAHPWGYMNISDSAYQGRLSQDKQIILVLRYPMDFTLTQRVVQGEMRSLALGSDLNYFDQVQISAQLSTDYKFGSKAVHKACNPNLSDSYSGNLLDGGIDVYNGSNFCSLFEEIRSVGHLKIKQNWKCNGKDEFCTKVGPFGTINDKERTLSLFVQNVHCEEKRLNNGNIVASVALVLRADSENNVYYSEELKSGLGNMTLAAEGVWDSSKGQLCMVGCLGIVDGDKSTCDSRVCFYIPMAFTIQQRSAFVGSISSINTETPLYPSLSFHYPIDDARIWRISRYTNFHYTYTKIGLARTILDNEDPSSVGNAIKKSLLKFPTLQENENNGSSLSLLAEDLTFHARTVSDNPSYVSMVILTVGSTFGSRFLRGNYSSSQRRTPYHEKAEYTKNQLLVNVSAQLSVTGISSNNVISLSVEGVYDPFLGKMYMIGCRELQVSTQFSLELKHLEGGLDCSTEVVISYPSITAQWLLHPGAGISIVSKRQEDDTLYFKPLTLKTIPITYRSQREGALSEKRVEDILQASTLSVVVACIVLQLLYIRRVEVSVPYVSLVMLGIQALEYSLPLFTGMESLFKRKHAGSNHGGSSYYELQKDQSYQAFGFIVKLLILIAFLLTLRLLQKVWKSRVKFLRRAPHEPNRVPNDKMALLVTALLHVAGFICVIYAHTGSQEAQDDGNVRRIEQSPFVKTSISSNTPPMQWTVLLEEYMGLVQDLFLFPQVVGNLVWQLDTKPLRKLYYIGISLVRVLPHIYDCYKSSALNPYFSEYYDFVDRNTGFYSNFSDIFIPVLIVILAVLVFVQQRWSYNKISDALVVRRCRLLPIRPKAYQKLPSQSAEAELSNT